MFCCDSTKWFQTCSTECPLDDRVHVRMGLQLWDQFHNNILATQVHSAGLCSPKGPIQLRSKNHQWSPRAGQRAIQGELPLSQASLCQTMLDKKSKPGLVRSLHCSLRQATTAATLHQSPCEVLGYQSSLGSSLTIRRGQHTAKGAPSAVSALEAGQGCKAKPKRGWLQGGVTH